MEEQTAAAAAPSQRTALRDALAAVLLFGAASLRAGNAAFRVKQWMLSLAKRLGIDELYLQINLNSIAATAQQGEHTVTLVREVGTPGVNVQQFCDLETLAARAEPGLTAKSLTQRIESVTRKAHQYQPVQIAGAIAAASAAFAFLNGGALLDIVAAGVGGAGGQRFKSSMLHRELNQFAVALTAAVVGSSLYCVTAFVLLKLGFGATANHSAGLISAVLFLVPGFPLVAALFDLLCYQTSTAVTRFAYGITLLAAAAIGLGIVLAVVGIPVAVPPASYELSLVMKWSLRLIASFVAAYGFAMLFNSSQRSALTVGLLGICGNGIRLLVRDLGLMSAPSAFVGAFVVGLLASLVSRRTGEPRAGLTVPGVIIMWPGVYAFQMIVLSSRGDVLPALQSGALVAFILGALAAGLASARFLTNGREEAD